MGLLKPSHIRQILLETAYLVAYRQINQIVPYPYLDEVFHVPQTQRYCQGQWNHWDDKITTPPGLYYLGVWYSKLALKLFNRPELFCSTKMLRDVNALGALFAIPLAVMTMKYLPSDTGVAISAFPLILFFSFLFYTDVWATTLVLLSLAIGSKRGVIFHTISAVVAAASITFRQTNIIWAGLIAVRLLDIEMGAKSIPKNITGLIRAAVTSPTVTIPFGAVAAGFVYFVKQNGGIALGDKSNHQVNANIPQLFYCVLFWAFFSWPLWLSPQWIKRYIAKHFASPIGLLWYVGFSAVIAVAIAETTVVHPFLLADNRHYTFYLWRRFISPSYHPFAKFLKVPVYHAAGYAFITSVLNNAPSLILAIAYLCAIALTIIPSPLLEPRYYILPYVVWRLWIRNASQKRLWAEFAYYMAINAVTVYVFLYRPFAWPHEPGVIQRFMW